MLNAQTTVRSWCAEVKRASNAERIPELHPFRRCRLLSAPLLLKLLAGHFTGAFLQARKRDTVSKWAHQVIVKKTMLASSEKCLWDT